MNPSYRAEILGPLFQRIRACESCALVGCASMGKSRLLRFMLEPEARRCYLGDQADATLFAYGDCNRLAEVSEWGFFELLLTGLVEACGQHSELHHLRNELNVLRREVILGHEALLARRHLELAALMVCRERGFRLCILLDEFDEAYRALPALALANLRALRDDNKAWLSYLLVLRNHPARLRPPIECEGFYELFSRSVFGLKPYTIADAGRVIEQLEARWNHPLAPEDRAMLIAESGGHPGLIVAMFGEAASRRDPIRSNAVGDECRKLWTSLPRSEQLALYRLARGQPVHDDQAMEGLELKGLVRDGRLFSPIFARYICEHGAPVHGQLIVDEPTRTVWVGDRAHTDLTPREFDLLLLLSRNPGRVYDRRRILEALNPGEHFDGLQHNSVDALVKRVRKKIEPVPDRPRYLLSVRGKGYKLVIDGGAAVDTGTEREARHDA